MRHNYCRNSVLFVILTITIICCEQKSIDEVNGNIYPTQTVDNNTLLKISFDSINVVYKYGNHHYILLFSLKENKVSVSAYHKNKDYHREIDEDTLLTFVGWVDELFIKGKPIIIEKVRENSYSGIEYITIHVALFKNHTVIYEATELLEEPLYKIKYSNEFVNFFNLVSAISIEDMVACCYSEEVLLE